MSISRRRFIEGSVATVGLAAVPRTVMAGSSPDIVDVEGTDHAAMVKAAIDALGGIKKFVRKGDYVVLKPNAGFANPQAWGTTTHPQTVLAVAKMCVEAGAKKITVVEFPQGKGMKCLERCGIAEAIAGIPEVSIKILGDKGDFKKMTIKGGVALQTTDVAKQVLSADVLINMPAAKHHTAAGVSLGLKNAMGLIYDRQTFHTLIDLQQGIVDLGRVIKPTLTIVDATRALLTNGPAGPGETSTPNRIIAGFNVVSVDAYALGVARFGNRQLKVSDVPHIELAGKAGLGETHIKNLKVQKLKA